MPNSLIIDSHIHLWPSSAANPDCHEWMTETPQIANRHELSDYRRAIKQDKVRGVVYIETDRRLEPRKDLPLEQWAYQPTQELVFLRSIVEKRYGEDDSNLLLGIVPWAPLNQSVEVFESWLTHAEATAGPETWTRVKGLRFLLQAITDKKAFEDLVFSDDFISILKSFRGKGRNFSFDVGIDQLGGGVWQLEGFAKVIELVHADAADDEKVTFIINHMCKPDMKRAPAHTSHDDYSRWCASMKHFSKFSNVYMKLSGGFTTLSKDRVDTASARSIADMSKPWFDPIFECFGPDKIMFGSDWPVCNLFGPASEEPWSVWKEVVQIALNLRGFTQADQDKIWSGTAITAYRLEE